MVFTTEGLLDVAIESWPEWDLNPRPLNMYIYTAIWKWANTKLLVIAGIFIYVYIYIYIYTYI